METSYIIAFNLKNVHRKCSIMENFYNIFKSKYVF